MPMNETTHTVRAGYDEDFLQSGEGVCHRKGGENRKYSETWKI